MGTRSRWGARRLVLVLAGVGAATYVLIASGPSLGQAAELNEVHGQQLYEAHCLSCHGEDLGGTADGPSLLDAGPADLHFMMASGRMPLVDTSAVPQRRPPVLSPAEISAVIAYVESASPGGTPIPRLDLNAGSLPVGQQVFAENCAACHGAGAGGDSIGGAQIAPGLSETPPLQIAEAVRIGPGAMPRFTEDLIDQHQLDSVVRYLTYLRDSGDRGGLGLGRIGPVTEGFVAALFGLGILLVVIRLSGTRT
jgi:quinol---cytochrome-c reductase cytochrome c subunit